MGRLSSAANVMVPGKCGGSTGLRVIPAFLHKVFCEQKSCQDKSNVALGFEKVGRKKLKFKLNGKPNIKVI